MQTTVTLSRADGLALPSAGWYAYAGWNGVSINQVAADELDLSKGDNLEITWYSYSDDGELIRETSNVSISSVIPMEGRGSMGGTKSPALFSSLEFAQGLQSKLWQVNRMRVSLVDDEDASGSITIIEELLDDLIDAEDSGFEVTTEGESMSISNGNGLGRLDENFMSSWSENKSILVGQGTTMEVLQVPLIQIEQGGK